MELIRVDNVEKTYKNGVVALYDFNLSIQKGEFVFVIHIYPLFVVFSTFTDYELYGCPRKSEGFTQTVFDVSLI